MKTLLEAGVHFGHQTRRWDPRMRPFIFTERNGIHIIDLQQTVRRLDEAMGFVRQQAAEGRTMLFVGTKKQAQDTIAEEAARAGMPFVNQRWIEYTGLSFGESLGFTSSALIHPDDAGATAAAWTASVREQREHQATFRLRRKDIVLIPELEAIFTAEFSRR